MKERVHICSVCRHPVQVTVGTVQALFLEWLQFCWAPPPAPAGPGPPLVHLAGGISTFELLQPGAPGMALADFYLFGNATKLAE